MKTCGHCKQEKSFSNFNKKQHSSDGYQPTCRPCQSEAKKKHYNDNKESYIIKLRQARLNLYNWFRNYKTTLKCEQCDETHPACMDFHHRSRKDKEFTVSQFLRNGLSIRTLKKEIAKCTVLCSNCHRKLHWDERHKID